MRLSIFKPYLFGACSLLAALVAIVCIAALSAIGVWIANDLAQSSFAYTLIGFFILAGVIMMVCSATGIVFSLLSFHKRESNRWAATIGLGINSLLFFPGLILIFPGLLQGFV